MATPLADTSAVIVTEFGIHAGAATADLSVLNAGKAASEYIITALVRDGRFLVIDQSLVGRELKNENVNAVGIIDPDTARRIGGLLHARYLIYGNVNDITFSDTGVQMNTALTGSVAVGTVKAHIIARMMDVTAGDIVMAAKGEGVSKSSYTKAGTVALGTIAIGTKTVTQDSVHNAVQKAAEDAVKILVKRLFGGK